MAGVCLCWNRSRSFVPRSCDVKEMQLDVELGETGYFRSDLGLWHHWTTYLQTWDLGRIWVTVWTPRGPSSLFSHPPSIPFACHFVCRCHWRFITSFTRCLVNMFTRSGVGSGWTSFRKTEGKRVKVSQNCSNLRNKLRRKAPFNTFDIMLFCAAQVVSVFSDFWRFFWVQSGFHRHREAFGSG